jgi:hypothetical protein
LLLLDKLGKEIDWDRVNVEMDPMEPGRFHVRRATIKGAVLATWKRRETRLQMMEPQTVQS